MFTLQVDIFGGVFGNYPSALRVLEIQVKASEEAQVGRKTLFAKCVELGSQKCET